MHDFSNDDENLRERLSFGLKIASIIGPPPEILERPVYIRLALCMTKSKMSSYYYCIFFVEY